MAWDEGNTQGWEPNLSLKNISTCTNHLVDKLQMSCLKQQLMDLLHVETFVAIPEEWKAIKKSEWLAPKKIKKAAYWSNQWIT